MSKKILIIEDDVDAAEMLKNLLSNAGYVVNALHEGTSLVNQNFPLPDMFILDNFMPTIHGLALCKFLKLQTRTKSIPVIIISGNKQLKRKAVAAGAASFLGKPFHMKELLKSVDKIFSETRQD